MRISDWSSDVCSSDLDRLEVRCKDKVGDDVDAERQIAGKETRGEHGRLAARGSVKVAADVLDRLRDPARRTAACSLEHHVFEETIGRASWRERVCQYV